MSAKLKLSPEEAGALFGSKQCEPFLQTIICTEGVPKTNIDITSDSLWLLRFREPTEGTPNAPVKLQDFIQSNVSSVCSGKVQELIKARIKSLSIDESRTDTIISSFCEMIVRRSLICGKLANIDLTNEIKQLSDTKTRDKYPALLKVTQAIDDKIGASQKIYQLLELLSKPDLAVNDRKLLKIDLSRQLTVLGQQGTLSPKLINDILDTKDSSTIIALLRGARENPKTSDLPIYLNLLETSEDVEILYQVIAVLYAFKIPNSPKYPTLIRFKEDPNATINAWKKFVNEQDFQKFFNIDGESNPNPTPR